MQSNIVYLPLFRRLSITTNGGALSKTSLQLNVAHFLTYLSQASAIWLVGLTEQVAAADVEWNVAFYSGFDRGYEQTSPIDGHDNPGELTFHMQGEGRNR